jgi:hypothetical protein
LGPPARASYASIGACGLGPFASMLGMSAEMEDAAAQLPGISGWLKEAGIQQLASNPAVFNSQANRFITTNMLVAQAAALEAEHADSLAAQACQAPMTSGHFLAFVRPTVFG